MIFVRCGQPLLLLPPPARPPGDFQETKRMSESRPIVAFQGERGAYSEQAARQHFGDVATLPGRAFLDITDALQSGRADFGMLPVENSLAGTVIPAYDLLMDYDLHIQAEVILRVEHCLMAAPGVALADVRRARSHPQALMQCATTLRRMGLEAVEYYDTAGAARDLAADPQPDVAVIASALAAETYGLDILVRHLEDEAFNFTRFFALGPDSPARQDPSKTSIILTTRHVPGALYAALGELARRDINMTKIESRPRRNRPWHYLFYVDFEGHEDDEPVREALLGILRHASFLKVLGSYPAASLQQP
jgi:prephenate dehydratase